MKETKQKYETFHNGEDAAAPGTKPPDGFTCEQAIEQIGFGWTQIRIGLMAGFAWVADGMEIMVLSILGPVLLCEWGISTVQEALLTTVVFIGFLVGSPVFGNWADKYGRRKSLILSSVWVLYFGILSAVSPNYAWMLVLRTLVGFGIGAGPQAITYYSEFLPISLRGKLIILVEVLWALGGMLTAVLALLLMPYGWRWWLMSVGIPVLLFVLFSITMPTSPRFDLACGLREKARKTLEKLAAKNGKSLPPGELLSDPVVPRGKVKDLVKPGFKVTSGLLSILWFSCAFIYYGLILFTTELIKAGDTCKAAFLSQYMQEVEYTCSAECQRLTPQDYVDLIWTSAAELPGLFLTVILIDLIGRKASLMVTLTLFSIACALLNICVTRIPMLFLLFTCRALAASAFQVLYVYTPEIYPTEVRALSVGIGSGFGRVGAIITPYFAEVLLGASMYAGVTVYAVIGIVAAVVAFLLPLETKGRHLAQNKVTDTTEEPTES